MDWGTFLTGAAQFAIAALIVFLLIFVGSAIVAAIIKGSRK